MPESRDRNQQGQTGTATLEPETHQTQAATGSPQAGPTSATGTQSGTTGTARSRSQTAGTQPGSTGTGSAPSGGLTRRGALTPASLLGDPFGAMRSMMDQMDRFFDDFVGMTGLGRRRWPSLTSAPQSLRGGTGAGTSLWYPEIEVREREGNLVVCADLPGMRKEDVHLEVNDDFLVLEGERRQEQEQKEEGWYRSERSYGRFYRSVPLPEGTNPDQAKASFKDGVLEVTVPLPKREQQEKQGRKIEIQ